MSRLRNITAVATAAYLSSTLPALAQSHGGGWWSSFWSRFFGGSAGPGHGGGYQSAAAVPEIDAASGAMAIAAVLAVMALTWELSRRRRRG